MFDWLRFVYRRMEYHIRHENVTSDEFKSLIGLLTGDPASPTLWNLYMSSLKMPPDMDDVVLGGLAMDMLAQADDILLLSSQPEVCNGNLMLCRRGAQPTSLL